MRRVSWSLQAQIWSRVTATCAALVLLFAGAQAHGQVSAQEERPNSQRSADSIVYHGKLVRPDGAPINGTLAVNVKITSPEPSQCLLWAETQTVESKNGGFSVELGYSQNRVPGASGGIAASFREVFINNPGLMLTGAQCAQGNSYNPTFSDDRLMTVVFQDGGVTAAVEKIPIKSVPFAKQAQELSGYGINNLFKISGTGSVVVFNPAEVQALKDASAMGMANQILGVDTTGTGLEYKTVTAGSGIQVTPSAGGIQISATGGGGGGSLTSVGVGGLPLSVVNATSSAVVSIAQANSGAAGYLSASDWILFNSKQPAGSYLTGVPANSVGTGEVNDGTLAPTDLNFAGSMAVNSGLVVRDGTQFYNKTCTANEALVWSVANGWSCSSLLLSESDPKIGANTTNMLSKWNGSSLVASGVFENSGNVGIGTLSPTKSLHVRAGVSGASGTSTMDGLRVESGAAGGVDITTPDLNSGRLNFGSPTNSRNAAIWGLYNSGDPSLSLRTNNTEWMRINSTGNVGIGTTSPSAKLEVAGQIKITGGTPGAGKVLQSDASGLASWATLGGSESTSVSNIGTAGVGVYKQMSGSNIELKKINAGSSALSVTDDTGNNELDVDLANLGVSTGKIADDAVTYGKLQNISANNRLLGRASAGAGDAEEITLGAGLSFSGTTLNGNVGTVTSVGVGGLPLSVVNATSTPTISIAQANGSASGFLSAADWTAFNSKQPAGAYLTGIDSSLVNSALGFTPVNRAGDTMTGALTLPSNGLAVGSSQLVVSGGNVGIGTTTPGSLMTVNRSSVSTTPLLSLSNSDSTTAWDTSFQLKRGGQDAFGIKTYYSGGNVLYTDLTANSGNYLRIFGNSSGSAGVGRIDLNASQIFANGLFAPQSDLMMTRSGDATSTATQRGSNYLQFQGSLWNGSSGEFRTASIRQVPSTTQNLVSRLAFSIHQGGSGSSEAERLSITASGNVGIGVVSPSVPLEVAGAPSGDTLRLKSPTTPSLYYFDVNQADTLTALRAKGSDMSVISERRTTYEASGGGWHTAHFFRTTQPMSYSGGGIFIDAGNTWAPTSGSGEFRGLQLANTINQTGTATGDYTILHVQASETSATGANRRLANFASGSTSRMVINTNGNVGIGTTSPAYKLDVSGDVNISGNFKVNGVNIATGGGTVTNVDVGGLPLSVVNSSSTPTISIAQANTSTAGFLSSADWNLFNNKQPAGSYLTAVPANSVGTGEVNDGTLAPADLNFAGSMATNTGVVVRNGTQFFNKTCAGNEALIWSVANGWICSALVLSESDPQVGANTTNMLSKWDGSALVASGVFESGGNVGIGTTSPSTHFTVLQPTTNPLATQVSTGIDPAGAGFIIKNTSTQAGGKTAQSGIIFEGPEYGVNTAYQAIMGGTNGLDYLDFYVSERRNSLSAAAPDLRISATGNVGIGTISPSAKLEVSGASGNTLKVADGNQAAGKVLVSDAAGNASWQYAGGLANTVGTVSGTSTLGAAVTNGVESNFAGGPFSLSLPAAGTYFLSSQVYFIWLTGCGDVTTYWVGSNIVNQSLPSKWQACGASGTSHWSTATHVVTVSDATTLTIKYRWTNAGTGSNEFGAAHYIKIGQ